jgi:hypothetical protein
MRTIEELERELHETKQREFDIRSLINNKRNLEKTYRRIEKATETLKDPNLPRDRKEYLERCLTRATTESVPHYTERIEFYEKKLGFRG